LNKSHGFKKDLDVDPVSDDQLSNNDLGDDEEFKEDPLNELMPMDDDLEENEGEEED
jgi:hypothetical protein